ncbi:DUF2484 family protein [Aquicoccus sp. SCR17]|nr:DUF2484 family protein [Carideicomes alvinocaridis]
MSLSLTLACLWVLAAALTALLPMRRQMVPGLALLGTAPVLLAAIGWQHGAWAGLLGLAGFVSMFRRPLGYLWKRVRGHGAEEMAE